jgi:diguanylate cyclase (GGDEF)-like protein
MGSSASLRVWILTLGMAAAGLVLGLLRPHQWMDQDLPLRAEWWWLALAFAASEVLVVHYQFRREQYSFTLMELPLALGLFFASWPALVAARLVGGGLALRLHRKQAPMKLAFNLASNVLETSIAVVTFRLIASSTEGPNARALTGALLATVFAVIVTTACIALAISIYEDGLDRRMMVRLFGANAIVAFTNASLALVAVAVVWASAGAGWLLLVVAVILFLGYRSYARLQQKHDDLELLYDFTRHTGRALHLDSAMRELLSHVQSVLRAGVAELIVQSPRAGLPLVCTRLEGNSTLNVSTMPIDRLWERVASSGSPLLASGVSLDSDMRAELDAHGMRDALIAPLRRNDGSLIGLMIAGNRLGELRSFTKDDLKLFGALANHASVSLENRHLIDRLRMEAADKEHQALHDALTGLPNRTLFQQRVDAVIEQNAPGTSAAVLLLDLDRFKEINDTLGHHTGDVLLQDIGARLRRALRSGDTIARLGGDEFGVLLSDLTDREAAVAAANGIRATLDRPFVIGDLTLDVGASIGIALWPDHGDDTTTLLQRADVAMYAAKEGHSGVTVYDPMGDTYSLERLSLVGELRQAIENGELAVHYQPKADARTGMIIGLEALVRWDHPRQGSISPEEIVRIAEQTGLIRPLTQWVLSQALRQCRAWRRSGRAFDVAVNLSARSMLDNELPTDVLGMLDDHGLPASALTFEITESSIFVDPVRANAILGRLRTMGIGLAIDDFGTGYSSFSQLRRMPVDEIKIDRSFVTHMVNDESDFVIVRSIVDLGRNLGLRTVAEGVEDQDAWEALVALGCDVVQGYVLSAALPAAELDRWLEQHPERLPDRNREADASVVRFPSQATRHR